MSKFYKTRVELVDEFIKLNPDVNYQDLGFRIDGRLEWFCEHGTGHTVWYPKFSDDIHGCCGCCKKITPLK